MSVVAEVAGLYRYPVKSMAGQSLARAQLGWHGLDGDRRRALRRPEDTRGFPWLSASHLPELLLFTPLGEPDVTHVRTPTGETLDIDGPELTAEISRRLRHPVEMMTLDHGMFDEAPVSVISSDTVAEAARLSSTAPDVRRFRPNLLLRLTTPRPFGEHAWLGHTLCFGDEHDGPAVTLTLPDTRCAIINMDPDTAQRAPAILKAIVREHHGDAGLYGTVVRGGQLYVGQSVHLQPR